MGLFVKEFRPLSPNTLLYWHLIRCAIEQGVRVFDFGRSTPDEGTYKFKQQWGAVPEPVCWEYKLINGTGLPGPESQEPQVSNSTRDIEALPLGVTNFLGPRIVRSIP